MTKSSEYTPPKVWRWQSENGGAWSGINRPVAGSTHQKKLAVGKHPLQLYSMGTANGAKVTIMLEELLAQGIEGAEYNAHFISISAGDQFGSDFVEINPNSKVPALVDYSGAKPVRIFESGAILLFLAEKFDALLPKESAARAECLSWLFWQVGSAPFIGGGFGHFYAYAPEKIKYCIDRFTMEVKRQLDVLDKHLETHRFLVGGQYTIADIAVWPWYAGAVLYNGYDAAEFLDTQSYRHVVRWAKEIESREAVQRGKRVNKNWGPEELQVPERHLADDIDKTFK